MKIVCSLGALIAWISIAFLLGLAVGVQLVSDLTSAPVRDTLSCCIADSP